VTLIYSITFKLTPPLHNCISISIYTQQCQPCKNLSTHQLYPYHMADLCTMCNCAASTQDLLTSVMLLFRFTCYPLYTHAWHWMEFLSSYQHFYYKHHMAIFQCSAPPCTFLHK